MFFPSLNLCNYCELAWICQDQIINNNTDGLHQIHLRLIHNSKQWNPVKFEEHITFRYTSSENGKLRIRESFQRESSQVHKKEIDSFSKFKRVINFWKFKLCLRKAFRKLCTTRHWLDICSIKRIFADWFLMVINDSKKFPS